MCSAEVNLQHPPFHTTLLHFWKHTTVHNSVVSTYNLWMARGSPPKGALSFLVHEMNVLWRHCLIKSLESWLNLKTFFLLNISACCHHHRPEAGIPVADFLCRGATSHFFPSSVLSLLRRFLILFPSFPICDCTAVVIDTETHVHTFSHTSTFEND